MVRERVRAAESRGNAASAHLREAKVTGERTARADVHRFHFLCRVPLQGDELRSDPGRAAPFAAQHTVRGAPGCRCRTKGASIRCVPHHGTGRTFRPSPLAPFSAGGMRGRWRRREGVERWKKKEDSSLVNLLSRQSRLFSSMNPVARPERPERGSGDKTPKLGFRGFLHFLFVFSVCSAKGITTHTQELTPHPSQRPPRRGRARPRASPRPRRAPNRR